MLCVMHIELFLVKSIVIGKLNLSYDYHYCYLYVEKKTQYTRENIILKQSCTWLSNNYCPRDFFIFYFW